MSLRSKGGRISAGRVGGQVYVVCPGLLKGKGVREALGLLRRFWTSLPDVPAELELAESPVKMVRATQLEQRMSVLAESQALIWLIVAVMGVLAVVAVMVKLGVFVRKRRAGVAQTAQELGLSYEPKADKSFRDAWAVLPEIVKSGSVKHLIVGQVDKRELTAFEHTRMVMVGNVPMVIAHCVYSTPAEGWPDLHVTRRGWFSRWRFNAGKRSGLLIGDEKFDAQRQVKSDSEEFARWLLGPDLRVLLLEDDSAAWRVVGQQLCLIYKHKMRAEQIQASIYRLQRFWSALPEQADQLEGDASPGALAEPV